MAGIGTEFSDSLLLVTHEREPEFVLYQPGSGILETISAGNLTSSSLFTADFDGDGIPGFAGNVFDRDNGITLVYFGELNTNELATYSIPGFQPQTVFDVDHDNQPELFGFYFQDETTFLAGLETAGIWSEGYPLRLNLQIDHSHTPKMRIVSLRGDGEYQVIFGYNGLVHSIELSSGRESEGFPVDAFPGATGNKIHCDLVQLDTDPDLEMVILSPSRGQLKVVNILAGQFDQPGIVWGVDDRNMRRTRNYWEPSASLEIPGSLEESDPYCWPNPVVDDLAHFRFLRGTDGVAELRVFDFVGREVAKRRMSFRVGARTRLPSIVRIFPAGFIPPVWKSTVSQP